MKPAAEKEYARKIALSHVAVLVPSVQTAGDYLKRRGFAIGKEELWENEGTKEVYVHRERGNSLLLMEAVLPGPYQRALTKRGPGLHHIAIDVPNVDDFLESLAGSGWFLLPSSLRTIAATKTAYLARPGFPSLIEVQQKPSIEARELFISEIRLPFDARFCALLPFAGLDEVVKAVQNEACLIADGVLIEMRALLSS